jgi:hypothetical protein
MEDSMTVMTRDAADAPTGNETVGFTVGYGPTSFPFEIPSGTTANQMIKMPHIRAQLGLKDGEMPMVIKGKAVEPHYVIRPGDDIEVVRAVDDKAR